MARRDRARRGVGIRAWLLVVVPLATVVGSCTSSSSSIQPTAGSADATSDTTVTAARSCLPTPLTEAPDLPGDPVEASLLISEAVFRCADTVYLTTTTTGDLLSAMALAAEDQAPLLVLATRGADSVAAEIERLAPKRIVFVGSDSGQLPIPPGAETVPADQSSETPASALDRLPAGTGSSWLVAPGAEAAAMAAAPAIVAGGGHVVIEPDSPPATGPDPASWLTIGDLDPTSRWQLLRPVVSAPLPGGGTELFPGRRIVAFYGSPVTFRLGLLGEQGPEATLERIAPLLEQYDLQDGQPVIAGFELIATVADSKPGDDGDYSNELTPAELLPWVEVAATNDVYVLIDLQPGRTDFLTQARRYEDLLRLPHVGLALDPEWRLEPEQVHLRQIGSVDAAEINLVVDYLASLVREEQLPQKLMVVHQFEEQMITNRELIRTPPELAVAIHVDGQGPLNSKYGTYETMLAAPIGTDQTLWWGWKNFVDEDLPMATPTQVNGLDPLPVVVTYQ